MSFKDLIYLSLIALGIWSCNQTPPPPDLFAGAQTIKLAEESATLKLPAFFQRSSIYRLSEDIPYLKEDTSFFRSIEMTLEAFVFEDKELDILVDTTSELRVLIIADAQRFEIDETSGKILNKQLGEQTRQQDEENLFLEINKIDSKMKMNSEIQMLKYKFEFVNTLNRSSHYRSLFFISNPSRSLLVIEISVEGNDIEDYLWTVKG